MTFQNSWQDPPYGRQELSATPHPASTPPLHRSPLTALPPELAHLIGSNLSPRSLLSLVLTSKHQHGIHAQTLSALSGHYTIPAVLTRIIGYYTHRDYGAKLVANLAPPHPNAAELPVPRAARELWAWHNGILDHGDWSLPIMMLPEYMSLCSYEQALEYQEVLGMDFFTREELEVWPVFSGPPPMDLFIIVDRAGHAAWVDVEFPATIPTDSDGEKYWFSGLYELLAALEQALEEGRLLVREPNGVPLGIVEGSEKGGFRSGIDDDDDDDFSEGRSR
ncbi:hypothetical protein EDC01DRAFT_655728 [Geopyxis carbonaria]|nr:hypothetical protein EDC01DRAFT_655728 [Geopyxis carbonaria]